MVVAIHRDIRDRQSGVTYKKENTIEQEPLPAINSFRAAAEDTNMVHGGYRVEHQLSTCCYLVGFPFFNESLVTIIGTKIISNILLKHVEQCKDREEVSCRQ